MDAFGEIQHLLYEDVVILPMNGAFLFVDDPRLKDFRQRSVGPVDYNYAYIEQSSE